MGGGCWTKASYDCFVNNLGFETKEDIMKSNVQAFYKSMYLAPELDPKNVIRECRDSEEHPCTLPIILALDVTGSMGSAAKACASKLDDIMTALYKDVKDVEFLMMGIGDMRYDEAPVQASQFESDIRILDQTSKIWFEAGGGANVWESYTAAWYFACFHTDLDCWKRGKKGILITMGDEMLNPYLPVKKVEEIFGKVAQGFEDHDIDTNVLYDLVREKYDVYHIGVNDMATNFTFHKAHIHETWKALLKQNYFEGDSNDLDRIISAIVKDAQETNHEETSVHSGGIRW